MAPPDRIQTERLLLRCWSVDDAPALRAALDVCDTHLRPWIPFMKHEPRSLPETAAWVQRHIDQFRAGQHFRYGVFDREGALVGEVMLLRRSGPETLEIGYWLHKDHCGRGYASEAVVAMIETGFAQDGVTRVEIQCDADNLPSNAIPERMGFTLEATEPLNSWVLTPVMLPLR